MENGEDRNMDDTQLEAAGNGMVEAEAAFTLRPKDGVWMTLHARR